MFLGRRKKVMYTWGPSRSVSCPSNRIFVIDTTHSRNLRPKYVQLLTVTLRYVLLSTWLNESNGHMLTISLYYCGFSFMVVFGRNQKKTLIFQILPSQYILFYVRGKQIIYLGFKMINQRTILMPIFYYL